MIEGPRLTIDDLIENVEITSEQPIDQAAARAEFGKYARILTTDTELSLSPELDEAAYETQLRAILGKAAFFSALDSTTVSADSSDNYLGIVLGGLDSGGEFESLSRKQKRHIRKFIAAAQADGKVTFEEIVDFLVLTDGMAGDDGHDLPESSLKAARLCLEENGIEPTPARIKALAQAAESDAGDGDEEEQAA